MKHVMTPSQIFEVGNIMEAASLMAIEVDTPAEQNYMQRLAIRLGLTAGLARRLQQMAGIH